MSVTPFSSATAQCACFEARTGLQRFARSPSGLPVRQLYRRAFEDGRIHAIPQKRPSFTILFDRQQSGVHTTARSSAAASDYTAPFSAVDPAVRSDVTSVPDSSTSSALDGTNETDKASTDKWGEVLAVNHTLSSLYLQKVEVQPFQQLDLADRRRQRELQEMCQAAAKLGIKAEVVEQNLEKLQTLVPGLQPNLDQMKASDWAKILKDVDGVVALIITLKTHYPKVDIGKLLQRTPKLLLKPVHQVQADAQQVKLMLSKVDDIDAIIEAVPYLMNPKELQQSLANLARWFPNQDPYDMLQKNPTMLVNIEEADLEADPLYGMPTIDPSAEWPAV